MAKRIGDQQRNNKVILIIVRTRYQLNRFKFKKKKDYALIAKIIIKRTVKFQTQIKSRRICKNCSDKRIYVKTLIR